MAFSLLTSAISIAAVIGTAITVVLVGDYFTGGSFSSWLQTVLGQMFQWFRHIGQVVFDHLPKPIRILVVVLLLGSVLGLIYGYTIGMTKICYQNDVVEVPYLEGLTFKFTNPSEMVAPTSGEKTERAIVDSLANSSAYNIDAPFNIVYPARRFLQMFNGNDQAQTGYESYLYNNSYGKQPVQVRYNYVTPKGTTIGKALFITVPYAELKSYFSGDYVYTGNDIDVWTKWWGKSAGNGQDPVTVSYSMCYDSQSHTCTVLRDDPGAFGNPGCFQGSGIQAGSTNMGGLYSDNLGSFQFTIWPQTKKLVVVSQVYTLANLDPYALGASISDCQSLDVDQVATLKANYPTDYTTVYSHIFVDNTASAAPTSISNSVTADNLIPATQLNFFECDSTSQCNIESNQAKLHSILLYGVGQGLLMRGDTQENDSIIYTNATSVLPEQQASRDSQTYTTVADILSSATPLDQGQYDLVQYTCDSETPDSFDTKMTVAGLNPFDPKIVIFLMVVGFMFSFIGWLRK
jgi:hypothetical protein